MWSCGVTLYFFVFGVCPFANESLADMLDDIQSDDVQVQFPPTPLITKELRDLISQMLEKNPTERIQLHQIMQHPWVTKQGKVPMRPTSENIRVTDEECSNGITDRLHTPNTRPNNKLFRMWSDLREKPLASIARTISSDV
eukprot:c1580_g1_i1.p1 GENE.c1580_g1_i1~~c1580_g1_i1.p1  ORF type:complete len:141 (-),score=38.85 c1580_g1_i1:71-493(-)